jgi:hypothetical protein
LRLLSCRSFTALQFLIRNAGKAVNISELRLARRGSPPAMLCKGEQRSTEILTGCGEILTLSLRAEWRNMAHETHWRMALFQFSRSKHVSKGFLPYRSARR